MQCNATTLSLSALDSCPVLVGQIEACLFRMGEDARNGGRNGITSSFSRNSKRWHNRNAVTLLLGLRKTERKKTRPRCCRSRDRMCLCLCLCLRVHLLLSAAPQIHGVQGGSRQGNANLVPPTRSTDRTASKDKTRQTSKEIVSGTAPLDWMGSRMIAGKRVPACQTRGPRQEQRISTAGLAFLFPAH